MTFSLGYHSRARMANGLLCLFFLSLPGCAVTGSGSSVPQDKIGTGGSTSLQQERGWEAVVGGEAGASQDRVISEYMDGLAGELAPLVPAQRIGDGIVITLNSIALFNVNSADLKKKSRELLRNLAGVLKKYDSTILTVIGHTDNLGSRIYNIHLSERRAKVVAGEFVGAGVPANRLRVMGLGFERPVASNDTVQGRMHNRRVEIHVVPDVRLRREAQSQNG